MTTTATGPGRARPGIVGEATVWAGVVLTLGTAVLALYVWGLLLVLSLMGGLGEALGLVDGDGSVDVTAVVVRAVTVAVVAWAVGLAAARMLAPGEAAPPWVVGMFSGALGCGAGVIVLHLVGLL
jgi:hypothetical protein